MHTSAIIYFSRLPGEEIRHKTFFDGNERLNNVIASKLFDHTASIIKKTGIPAFYYSEQYQHGESFGERISNAMAEVFGLGYDSVIVVGSDTPNLDSASLLKTNTLLLDNPLVAGPTQLGGCYLLGIQKNAFNKNVISSLPWQSAKLMTALASLAPAIFLLTALKEINNAAQLYLFTKTAIKAQAFIASFIQLIISWINSIQKNNLQQTTPAVVYINNAPGRAP